MPSVLIFTTYQQQRRISFGPVAFVSTRNVVGEFAQVVPAVGPLDGLQEYGQVCGELIVVQTFDTFAVPLWLGQLSRLFSAPIQLLPIKIRWGDRFFLLGNMARHRNVMTQSDGEHRRLLESEPGGPWGDIQTKKLNRIWVSHYSFQK